MKVKLAPLMLPSSTWGVNLRNLLGRRKWTQLAKLVYKRDGYRCRVCGGKGRTHPVECHEEWLVNEKDKTLTLVGFISLCPKCHLVQHTGFAFSKGRGREVISQLMRVNEVTKAEAEAIVDQAYREWEKREKLGEWVVVIPSGLATEPRKDEK